MKKISVGMIGSGFAAAIHADAYRHVSGVEARVEAVCSLDEHLPQFAGRYGIARQTREIADLMRDPAIDAVDICTPPASHKAMIVAALRAGKHVICEKPLTGFFGGADFNARDGSVSRRRMLENVIAEMDELQEVIAASGKLFCYAENYIYAPAVQKCVEFLAAKRSKILFMRGEESHSGSHAAHAAHWRYSGGGALIRLGCHPLSVVLYLKRKEASLRGEPYGLQSVMADVGVTQACLSEAERRHIASRPADVEDMANVLLTFADGTKAHVVSGDMIVGGVRNLVEVFTNEGVYINNISPNSGMVAYHADEARLDDVYITEKVGNKSGWQFVCLDEQISRGYVGEMQDFMECIAHNRKPLSGFSLAYETIKAVYMAYCAAEERKSVVL